MANKLFTKNLKVTSLNWIKNDIKFPMNVTTKIRYNHNQSPSTLIKSDNNNIMDVIFEKEQFAITPGQTAVFYENDVVIGSGIIIWRAFI